MRDRPELELDRQLCFPLYAAAPEWCAPTGRCWRTVGLTYPQYLALLVLWGSPERPVTVGELGTRLGLETGTLTPLLKRLERAGHIVAGATPPTSGACGSKSPTRGGRCVRPWPRCRGSCAARSRSSADEAAELRRLLDRLLGALEAGGGPGPGS